MSQDGAIVSSVAMGMATMVQGSVEGQSTSMLVDTGSAVTLIRDDLWREATRGRDCDLEEPPYPVMAANGQNLNLLGKADVFIHVGGVKAYHGVLVATGLTQKVPVRS